MRMKKTIVDINDCCNRLGRPKDKHKQGAILDAAAELIVVHGFEGTSMDRVAKAAGVSKQTVYSHFKNKETLFREAVSYYSQKMISFDDLIACEHTPVEETLSQFAEAFVNLTMSAPSIAVNSLVVGPSKNSKKLAKIFYEAGPKVCKENLKRLLENWNKQKRLSVPDIHLATSQFIALLTGEAHYLTTLGLKTDFPDKEKQAHVKNSVSAFLKIYS